MNLDHLRDHIAANTDLVEAETLFIYRLPPYVDRGVLLVFEQVGGGVDHEIPGLYWGRLQIIVRDPDYKHGEARANEMFNLLRLNNVTLGDQRFDYVRPRHLPVPFRRSPGDAVEWSVNFDARFKQPV